MSTNVNVRNDGPLPSICSTQCQHNSSSGEGSIAEVPHTKRRSSTDTQRSSNEASEPSHEHAGRWLPLLLPKADCLLPLEQSRSK
jgi:hypothetical protein